MPDRLIVLNMLHPMTNHDLLLSLLHYLSHHLPLTLYLVSISINNANEKTFWILSYLLIG